ncbi:conserved hypothetical protein, partial [Ricinus communis]
PQRLQRLVQVAPQPPLEARQRRRGGHVDPVFQHPARQRLRHQDAAARHEATGRRQHSMARDEIALGDTVA